MISKIKSRLASDEGFTLIELLVVIVILGILLAIAVPSYLGFKTRAEKSAAKANVRSAFPAMEAWYADHGTYAGATRAQLILSYDAGLKASVGATLNVNTYCIFNTVGGSMFHATGPAGTIKLTGACA
jgi:prepilin-type N-terminal cleavage/methylation domain-containing protein